MLDLIRVTITKTSDRLGEYIQVMSHDQTSVNVVIVAKKIEIQDMRETLSKLMVKGPGKRG